MFEPLQTLLTEIAWPTALALAWVAGELGHRWLALPRISAYGLVGFVLGATQSGFLPSRATGPIALLADIAFGLIMFELGYRINLRWIRTNPWLGLTSVVEAVGTFATTFAVADWYGVARIPSFLLAALAMSTSPAAVLRVVNELRSSGQVTERALHLSAFNCVLAVIAFKIVIGYWVIAGDGNISEALWNSLVLLIVSSALGALFGTVVPGILRASSSMDRDNGATVAFAVAVIALTALTYSIKFSPLLAALVFGIVARHRRIVLSHAQRNFGPLGDLLTILLFVFVAAALDWRRVESGLGLALAVIASRAGVKLVANTALSRAGGITLRKGALTGMALTPLSVVAILLLEQSRHLGLDLVDEIPAVAAMIFLLEIVGPIATQRALVWAGEAQRDGAV